MNRPTRYPTVLWNHIIHLEEAFQKDRTIESVGKVTTAYYIVRSWSFLQPLEQYRDYQDVACSLDSPPIPLATVLIPFIIILGKKHIESIRKNSARFSYTELLLLYSGTICFIFWSIIIYYLVAADGSKHHSRRRSNGFRCSTAAASIRSPASDDSGTTPEAADASAAPR